MNTNLFDHRYELLRQVGKGGTGLVYLAYDTVLKREVVLKIPRDEIQEDPAWKRRFIQEAKILATLQNTNIVRFFHLGCPEQGPWYLVLEYVEGGTLADQIGVNQPQDERRSAETIAKIARALHQAHATGHGVIHRDLKPENILLTKNGTPKVTDFGIARRVPPPEPTPQANTSKRWSRSRAEERTTTGRPLGTPSYMAPEQATGRHADCDARTDVYGLGAILYRMLTGRQLFEGSYAEVLLQVITEDPPPPSRFRPQLSWDLETICLKCLQKSPRDRYSSALALAEDTEHWLAGEPIEGRRPTQVGRMVRWCRRKPWQATALFGFLLLAVSTVAFARWGWALKGDVDTANDLADKVADDDRNDLMRRLERGDHSPDTRRLAVRVAKASPHHPGLQLVPIMLELTDARTPEQHQAIPGNVRDALGDRIPNADDYRDLFVKLAALHALIDRMIDQDGGLAPAQQRELSTTVNAVEALCSDRRHLTDVTTLPTVQRLLRTANRISSPNRRADRPTAPFADIHESLRPIYWRADALGSDPPDGLGAEVYYQLGACYLALCIPLSDFTTAGDREACTEALRLAAAAFNRASATTPVTAGPRFRLKARTGEATAVISLLRFVPTLTPKEVDTARKILSTFRDGTTDAPIDAQRFSRLTLLSLTVLPLTPAQKQLWIAHSKAFRDRVEIVYALGSNIILEWEGAETTLWSAPNPAWDPALRKQALTLLARLRRNGFGIPTEVLDQPANQFPRIKELLREWRKGELNGLGLDGK